MADLRAALPEEREAREQEGWKVGEVALGVGFFSARVTARGTGSSARK